MTLRHALVPAYLAACLLLGGASAAGYLANLVLQLLALPIIVWALMERPRWAMPRAARRLEKLLGLLAVLFAVQLVPLPPAIWTLLPGRGEVAQGYSLLGQPLPWLPISLAPDRTIADFLWLLPAIAVLLAMVRLGAFRERWIAWTIVAVTMLAVLAGAAQVGGGAKSPWYFYQNTNWGQAVGFFANSNHMATLLVATLPFLAGLYRPPAEARRRRGARMQALAVILGCGTLVIVIGIALNSSLAGAGLAVPALAMSLVLLRANGRRVPGWAIAVIGVLTLGGVATIMMGPFGNNLTGPAAQSQYSRKTSFSTTANAGLSYFPFGAGIGSFYNVYPSREDPREVTTTYINHAHSDPIEIFLETGVFGIALICVFLAWWMRGAAELWRMDHGPPLARAATIASAAILAHSLVDYPLRTAAISALLACCCALIADARPRPTKDAPASAPARHMSAD